jgi:adenylate cyclase
MTLSNTGSVLATLTQLTQLNRTSVLTHRVKDLSVPEFICLLDFITAEFQQFLRAIEMINNEALETMLEQVMDAFTLKIGQILQADRTTIFLVDADKGQLWAKIPQSETNKAIELRIPLNVGLAGHVATTGSVSISQTPTTTRYLTKKLTNAPAIIPTHSMYADFEQQQQGSCGGAAVE